MENCVADNLFGLMWGLELPDRLQNWRQDIDWIREHTRLGEVADRWESVRPSRFAALAGG